MKLTLTAVVCSWATALQLIASDWPQFLGPERNGVSPEKLARPWPTEGPPQVWQRPVGQGFSGPVVEGAKLILFHRLGDREAVECLQAATGQPIWKFDYPTHYRDDFGFDEGPRATPTIHSGRVFTFGAEGMLHCLDFETGKKLWSVDTKERFSAGKGFFGLACSPLVSGNAVLMNIGGPGAGIVAFDLKTGATLWKATDDEASYSSPTTARMDGRDLTLFFTRAGLVGIEPANGQVLFSYPWRSRQNASVNAATPLVVGDEIFLSASYQTGAILLRLHGNKLRKIWSGDDILSNHYSTSVHREGFIYGFDGRQESGQNLRCVEWKSGKVRWKEDGLGAGTVTAAGEELLVLLEDGRLLRLRATPEKFERLAEAQILPTGVRAYPALAGGKLFARSKDRLVCVKVD